LCEEGCKRVESIRKLHALSARGGILKTRHSGDLKLDGSESRGVESCA
jgi:hypothetical protein